MLSSALTIRSATVKLRPRTVETWHSLWYDATCASLAPRGLRFGTLCAVVRARSHRKAYATIVESKANELWDQGKHVDSFRALASADQDNSIVTSRDEVPASCRTQVNDPIPANWKARVQNKKTGIMERRRVSRRDRAKRRMRVQHAEDMPATESSNHGVAVAEQAGSSQAEAASTNEQSTMLQAVESKKTPQLLDVDFVQKTKPLPTRAEYPHALPTLFSHAEVAAAIHGGCGSLKIPIQVDVDYTQKDANFAKRLRQFYSQQRDFPVCTVKIDIPGVFQGSATGEGLNKKVAKQAAWLSLVSTMHVDGSLRILFPTGEARIDVSSLSEGDIPTTTDVDTETLKLEKDAKIDIYNYAASLGAIPVFRCKTLAARRSRRLPFRAGDKDKSTFSAIQVRITLKERGIDVSAVGRDAKTAEIAAALAFKKQAELQYKTTDAQLVPSDNAFGVLKDVTAKSFFEFYKHDVGGLHLEIEHDTIQEKNSNTQNIARLKVNGEPVGHAATMNSKIQAEKIAYLTAAVEIAKADPSLLRRFEETLKRGNKKALRPMASVDVQIDFAALQAMRSGLLEARDAGLPDSRSALSAESQAGDNVSQRRSRRLSPRALMEADDFLHTQHSRFSIDPGLAELRAQRAGLPMSSYRTQVLKMVGGNTYSVIVGATGSGKTTQVPQILFEDAIMRGDGGSCKIICTQPRRIAATSVAQRVAVERNEQLRETVGYHVRFDARPPREPYGITYCTTGILLERLKHDPDDVLETATHLIIDEVHERDLNVDFLMIVVRRAIRSRQAAGKRVPKVVLMSATLDTEHFAKYFEQSDERGKSLPCPSISVPGRTFQVSERYLGSVMSELLEAYGTDTKSMLDADPQTRDYLAAEVAFSKGAVDSQSDSVIDWKRERQTTNSEEDTSVASEREEALVPMSLVVATVAHIAKSTHDGAVLVFLPGLQEIVKVQKMLQERNHLDLNFNDSSRFQICPLHSTIPKEQQDEIFQPTMEGCRRIILSTNISETSVTVTSVKYVVDAGKLRETRYDQARRITRLQCVWQSKSNARQRAGRAGRVQNGHYYALFSKERYDSLKAAGLPELLRSDLSETCLAVTSQRFREPVASFLAQAIEPPSSQAVEAAINNLIAIEAYTEAQEITALGRVLARLPVHPSLGKMVVLGVVFRCLDPIIVLGAAMEERSLFVTPLDSRAEARRAHSSYVGQSRSDHIAFYEAFNELRMFRDEYGMSAAFQRARENYLHMGAFRTIAQTAAQIETILAESGLITPGVGNKSRYGSDELNRNSDNVELIKCLLMAGFHPNLGAKTISAGLSHRTQAEHNVLHHPSSLNSEFKLSEKNPHGTLFTYSTLARSNDSNTLFMRDSTYVTPLMAILFGGQLRTTSAGGLEIDRWLPFSVKAADREFISKLVLEFRKALDRVLNSAFRSLSDLEPGQQGSLGQDPIQERFVERLIEVLDLSTGRQYQNMWPRSNYA